MIAARRRAIRVVNQNVIVASGANNAVDRLRELLVFGRKRVVGLRFVAIHRHFGSLRFMVSIPAKS